MNRELLLDKEYLKSQYWNLGLTLEQISRLIDCSRPTVKNYMIQHNIPIRKQHYHLKELNNNFEHQSNAGKNGAAVTNKLYSYLARKRMLENNVGYLMHIKWKERDPEGYLEHQHRAAVASGNVMRERFKNGFSPLKIWQERNPEEFIRQQRIKGKKRGEQISRSPYNHPNFDKYFYEKYGMMKSKYPYPEEFFKIRTYIIDRDENICKICGIEHPINYVIHHIDNNKLNNDPNNLVFLCQYCHNKKTHGHIGERYKILLEGLNH